MELSVLFLAAMATYRVAYFIPYEDGPFEFMARIRTYFSNLTYDYLMDVDASEPRNPKLIALVMTIDDMISCPYCVGFWVSLIVVAPIALYLPVLLVPFAIAGAAHLIERIMQAVEGDND